MRLAVFVFAACAGLASLGCRTEASSASADAPAPRVSQAARVSLPAVDAPDPAASPTLPVVTVSGGELRVGDARIADVTPGPLGFAASLKRAGKRAALEVVPLDAALRALRAKDPAGTALRFAFDRATSYRTALEVVFTASHAGFASFAFSVASRDGERSVTVSIPSRAEWDAAHKPGAPQPPSFVLDAGGATLTVGEVAVGAGCALGAAGPAAPLDAAAIGECAARVKGMKPGWSDVGAANVSAAPELDLETVLRAVAAIERTYPSVHFGLLSG